MTNQACLSPGSHLGSDPGYFDRDDPSFTGGPLVREVWPE
jgi:hypothetical protein